MKKSPNTGFSLWSWSHLLSKTFPYSSRNMSQLFQPGPECNSMSSIQRSLRIFHNPNRSWQNPKILVFHYGLLTNTFPYSSRSMFQLFQPGSKGKSVSSIQRSLRIFHNPNRLCKNPKILVFHHGLLTNTYPYSSRNIFQLFQPGFTCNSMSSIQWSLRIFHNPNRSWQNPKILVFTMATVVPTY